LLRALCVLHRQHMLDLYGLLFLRRNVYLLHRSAPYIPSTQLFLRATSVSPLHERALHGLPRFMPLYLCALSRHFIFLCALCVLHLGSVITAQTEHAPGNTFQPRVHHVHQHKARHFGIRAPHVSASNPALQSFRAAIDAFCSEPSQAHQRQNAVHKNQNAT
jgi:hypothetical protein